MANASGIRNFFLHVSFLGHALFHRWNRIGVFAGQRARVQDSLGGGHVFPLRDNHFRSLRRPGFGLHFLRDLGKVHGSSSGDAASL